MEFLANFAYRQRYAKSLARLRPHSRISRNVARVYRAVRSVDRRRSRHREHCIAGSLIPLRCVRSPKLRRCEPSAIIHLRNFGYAGTLGQILLNFCFLMRQKHGQ